MRYRSTRATPPTKTAVPRKRRGKRNAMRTKVDHPKSLLGDTLSMKDDAAAEWLRKNDPKIRKAAKNRRRREKRREQRKAGVSPQVET